MTGARFANWPGRKGGLKSHGFGAKNGDCFKKTNVVLLRIIKPVNQVDDVARQKVVF